MSFGGSLKIQVRRAGLLVHTALQYGASECQQRGFFSMLISVWAAETYSD